MYCDPAQEYNIFSNTVKNVDEANVLYGGSADSTNRFTVWKVTGKNAVINYRVTSS